MNLSDLKGDPYKVWINDVEIDLRLIHHYAFNYPTLSLLVQYQSMEHDLIRFGTFREYFEAVDRFGKALSELEDY